MAREPRRSNLPDPADFGGSWAPAGTTTAAPYVLPDLSGRRRTAGAEEEAAKDKPSTIIQGVKRGAGGALASFARAAQDVGLPTEGIQAYGEKVVADNPADVMTLGDIGRHPVQFVKETLAELAPQLGISGAGAMAGARLGAMAGAPFEGIGAIPGAAIGAGIGAFAPSWIQSYGGQRSGQDEAGTENRGRAALAASGSAALDLIGPEAGVVRRFATGGLKKSGLGIVKRPVVAGLVEGGVETGQDVVEDYGTRGEIGGEGSLERYGMSGIKGLVGGTVAGAAEQTFGNEHLRAKPQTLPEDETRARPVDETPGASTDMLALPAPEPKRLTAPVDGPIRGEAPVEHLRLTDQRKGRPSQVYGPAIADIESRGSGDYQAVGPVTKRGDRAYGKYQMMGRNLPQWTREALGREMAPQEFLADPEAQDRVFDHVFGGLVERFGNAEDAASAWFTGRPRRTGSKARDVLGTSGEEYVQKFAAAMARRGDYEITEGPAAGTPGRAGDEVSFTADELRARIDELAGDDVDETTADSLAPEIAKGGEQAAAAIGRERERLQADFDSLAEIEDRLLPEDVSDQQRRLASRERTIMAAVETAERLAKARGPEIVTEAPPLRADRLPAGPQVNPELAQLGEQLATEGAQARANDLSARSQMEQAQLAQVQPRVDAAAEAAERGKVLARVIASKSANPRADFAETLRDMGLPEALGPSEERTLRMEESFRRREALAEAQAQQAALPAQDTSLGVRERPAPAPEPVQPTEPTAQTKPTETPAPAPTPQERAAASTSARADAHIATQSLGPVQAKWFREGMKAELGQDHETPTATKGATLYNFERGKKFAAAEREQQAREAEASTPPARPAGPRETRRKLKSASVERQRETQERAAQKRAGLPVAARKAVEAKKPEPVAPPAKKAPAPAAKAAPKPAPKPVEKAKAPTPKAPTKPASADALMKLRAKKAEAEAKAQTDEDVDEERQALMKDIAKARNAGEITPLQAKSLTDKVTAETVRGGVVQRVPTDNIAAELALLSGETKQQAVTRRGLAGLAAGAMGSAAFQAQARTNVDGVAVVDEALKTGKLDNVVRAVMKTTKNPQYRELARLMLLGGFAKGTTIQVSDEGNASLNTLGVTNTKTGNVLLYKTTNGPSGVSEETILHEALHSWVAGRYNTLDIGGVPTNLDLIGAKRQSGDKFNEAFRNLWFDFHTMMQDKHPNLLKEIDENIWAIEAAADPDELFVRVFTDDALQNFLRTHDIKGNKIAPANPTSIWAKIMGMIRSLFGVKPSISALSEISDAGWSVLKAGALDTPDFDTAARVTAYDRGEKLDRAAFGDKFQRVKAEKKTPEAYARRTAVNKAKVAVDVSGRELLKKMQMWLSGTEDIANRLGAVVPSARKLIDLVSNGHAEAREFEERLANIKSVYQSLPAKLKGTKPGSISDYLLASTTSGKWGYDPGYVEGGVTIDPEMAKMFKAIEAQSKKAADVIRDVFLFNHEGRQKLYREVVKTIDAEYKPLLDVATTEEQTKRIKDDWERALKNFSRVFDTQAGTPYTPIAREGAWAVVGKSDTYKAAEKAKDQKALDKMADDPEHHYVDFRDTLAEAEALASHVATKFGPKNVYQFERGKVEDGAIVGEELFLAFDQVKKAINAATKAKPGEGKLGKSAAQRMDRLVTDLYLSSLSEASARKAELGRKNVPLRDPVTGEVVDMMHAFVTRGSAMANYIASISNGPQITSAIYAMKDETSNADYDKRQDAQRGVNEVMFRYSSTVGAKPSRVIDRAVRAVSIWTLLTSPFYYLQNATQHSLIAVPLMASKYGYGAANRETWAAYSMFGKMTKGTKLNERIDFKNAPKELHGVLEYLAKRGRLDAGFAAENGHWEVNGDGVLPQTWNKVDAFLRMMPQRVEVANRVVTGIATYKLAIADGKTETEAREIASQMIYEAHGDYSGINSPTPFHVAGNFGKVALQFRKFQLIMGQLVARQFRMAFAGATREEKVQGFKALAFLSAHMAAIGGIVGQPGAALLGPVIGALLNMLDDDDDKDWNNWQEDLKEALGAGGEGEKRDWLADLLYKGAPYALLSMDTSDRLGMGNILSLAPYSDLPAAVTNKEKFYETMGQLMLGPSGGMMTKAIDGWGFAEKGDWGRVAESLMPGVFANSAKAFRLETEGLTDKKGDVLMPPEDISGLDGFYTAMGVRPRSLTNQAERRSKDYAIGEYYDAQTSKLKSKYIKAVESKDPAKVRAVREEFEAVQDARARDGIKRQPLSTLLKAPSAQAKRERNVIGGVPTTAANRTLALQMLYADTPQDALDATP